MVEHFRPSEHKTVRVDIPTYVQEIGWAYVPRDEAEGCRGFDPDGATPEERTRKASLYFGDSLSPEPRALLSNREGNS
jgi:hypothetical protein